MAHRIAELMEEAESGKRQSERVQARKEATKTILELWERRSHWPVGWPPPNASAILARLNPERRPPRELDAPSGSPWLDRLGKLDALLDEESELWLSAGLVDVGYERPALEFSKNLTQEELEVIEAVNSAIERAQRRVSRMTGTASLPSATMEERARLVATRLEELAQQRASLVQDVLRTFADEPNDQVSSNSDRKRRRSAAKAR